MEAARQALAVALVFALLGGALAWLRKRGALRFRTPLKSRARQLQPIERVILGPGHVLHVVRWGDRALLISTGSGGCRLLETRSSEPEVRA